MSSETPRTLIPLEQRTWVSILVIGAGFGLVVAVALFIDGDHLQGLITAAIPAVFGYTAAHLTFPSPLLSHGSAVVANVGLNVASIWVTGRQVMRGVDTALEGGPPALVLVLAMSAFLHVAVVVVSGESLVRLRHSARGTDVGDEQWQCT